MKKPHQTQFEKAASTRPAPGLLRELWDFLKHNKKWWLMPIVAMLLILGFLIALSSTGLAPFIYTLF